MDINLFKLNSFGHLSIFWHKSLEAQAEKCMWIFNIGKAVILNWGNERVSAVDYKLLANAMQNVSHMFESSEIKRINRPHLFPNVFGCMIWNSVFVMGEMSTSWSSACLQSWLFTYHQLECESKQHADRALEMC